jgi:hypothetical protein
MVVAFDTATSNATRRMDTYTSNQSNLPAPVVVEHEGVLVVRDDLFPGGTKARFLGMLFDGVDEVVYPSPAEGGAQVALATVARSLSKRATIFVARRAKPACPHDRSWKAWRQNRKHRSGVPVSRSGPRA